MVNYGRKLFLTVFYLIIVICIISFGISPVFANQAEIMLPTCNQVTSERYNIFINVIIPLGIEFFGAFLGFLSAILLSAKVDKRKRTDLEKSLCKELETIKNELEERLKDNTSDEIYSYITTAWDINLASGSLSFITNNYIYRKYFDTYSKIQYAQQLEKEYIKGKLSQNSDNKNSFTYRYIQTMDVARKREAQLIFDMIKKLLKEKEHAN